MDKKKTIKDMNFEEALAELESIVQKIDQGSEGLQKSIDDFERGVLLKKHCESLLKNAKMKIEKIVSDDSGQISTKEAEI